MTKDNIAKRRKAEQGNIPVRSDRLFTQHNYWYFRTREGMDIGPFDTISEALEGIQSFIDFIDTTEPAVVSRITQYVCKAA